MKKFIFLAIVLGLFIAPVCAQKSASVKKDVAAEFETSDSLGEEFSFRIENFKMDHQGEHNNLNIKVRLRYESGIPDSDYPDFLAVAKGIEEFLRRYPNKVDYWEIVNKKLTLVVLKKYPVVDNIESEIQVSPSAKVGYTRSSTVTRRRQKRT